MTDSGGNGNGRRTSADQDADEEHPWGTVLIMVLFVLMIIGDVGLDVRDAPR